MAGCEVLCEAPPAWFASQRLGLLANQASVDRAFTPVSRLITRQGGNLACLFSPQHGFYAEKQANMRESEDSRDPALRLPIYSLYGAVREPSGEMLEQIDVLLVDLQDVGTRVYTYSTTLGLCMEAAARHGVRVVVLDRPNPISGEAIEGNILQAGFRSFVGRYPLPMRHGLTLGELARYLVAECNIECDLEVIPMKGWHRRTYHPDTGRPWIFPSPNMPTEARRCRSSYSERRFSTSIGWRTGLAGPIWKGCASARSALNLSLTNGRDRPATDSRFMSPTVTPSAPIGWA